MDNKLIKDGLIWGFVLWLTGYILGILLFPFVPNAFIGWVIMPVGISLSLFVLFKKIKSHPMPHYFKIAVIWTVIAVILDYLLLVKLFKPADGYYKADVYLYYLLTFLLPLIVGWLRKETPDSA